jgi:tetratricopeptide (TPR) repeat protein
MDPEEVHDVIVPLLDRLQSVVESYGGTVVNTMGDGFFAVFGAPVAHPDDAERAVRAAFATRVAARASREGPAFDLHCGVHTGWASIAPGRQSPGSTSIEVVGDTVNTASRIAGLAEAGVVLVGETTHSLTTGSIRYRELDPVTVKGKAEPLRVFEAMEVRNSTLERFFEPAFTPLIGRDLERQRLDGEFARVVQRGASTVAVIAGAPGVGKSRLASEFAASLPDATLLVGRGVPFGERTPWLAISHALRGLAGIDDGEALDSAREKLWTAVEHALPSAPGEEHAQLVARLGLLLRIEEQPQPSRAVPGEFNWEMAAALRRFMTALAEQRPVVLIVEDLQWADPEVASFVRWVHDQPWNAPVLILGLVWEDALDTLGFTRDDDAVTTLTSLDRPDLDALTRFLLPGGDVPDEVAADLAIRSGGNPLFLQEIVHLLREQDALVAEPGRWVLRDAQARCVPESVHLVVAARLDGLSPEERRLVRDAAVCGAVFSPAALHALGWHDAGAVLRALEDRGLVFRRRTPDGAEEFGFHHTVIRDVAYDSIPRSERAGKHLAVAEWLRGAGDEPVEVLAYHYAQAALVGLQRAAGDVASLAVTYLTRAGDRALAQRALREAEQWYRQAIEVQPPVPARAHTPEGAKTLAALSRHAEVLYDLSRYDEAREEASRALEMAGIAGDARAQATAYLQLAKLDSLFGDVETARKVLELADAKFREACDDVGRAHVVRVLADTFRMSDIPRMMDGLEQAARMYAEAGDWRNQHFVYEDLAYAHTTHSHAEFERFLRADEPLVERSGDRRSRAALLRTRGFHAFYRGRFDEAVEPLAQAMALARDAGDVFVECDCMYVLARIHLLRDEIEEARRLGEALVRFGASQRLRRTEEEGLVVLARIAEREGRRADADRALARSRALLEEIGAERELVEVVLAEAQIALERAEWERAFTAAHRYGVEVARSGDVLEESRALLLQARGRFGAGAHEDADRLAAAALALAEAEGQPDVRAEARAVRASALAKLGRDDDARMFSV